jgi:hypothetical protein
MAELGDSNAVYPQEWDATMPAVRTGGRRRRSSPTPRCNGEDMVKVRQGKPVKKGSQRTQRGKQMTALRGWCTSPSVTANPPFQVDKPNWESGVRGNVPAPFGAGERLQSPTYRYPTIGLSVDAGGSCP